MIFDTLCCLCFKLKILGQDKNDKIKGKMLYKYPSSIRGTEADVSAEDLKPDPWSGNHPAAPECETNTCADFTSTYLGDRM